MPIFGLPGGELLVSLRQRGFFSHIPLHKIFRFVIRPLALRRVRAPRHLRQADSFGSGGNAFTIDFVTIGNAGNVNDSGTTGSYFTPYGGVAYEYRMGTYEISEDMIDKANTLGGLLIAKDTRGVNKAATSVSWNEAARFVNWLNVSQGYAVAYKFTLNPGDGGYVSNTEANANLVLWTPGDAGYDASNPYRNSTGEFFLAKKGCLRPTCRSRWRSGMTT